MIIARLVNPKQAYDYGFAINGEYAYIYEVPGVMVGCLGKNNMHEPGCRFDTVDGELFAWFLHTDKANTFVDCELIPKINKIIEAIQAISNAIGKEETFKKLGIIFPLLGLEQA